MKFVDCPYCKRKLSFSEYYFQFGFTYTCPQCHETFSRRYRSFVYVIAKIAYIIGSFFLFAFAGIWVARESKDLMKGIATYFSLQVFVGFSVDACLDIIWRETKPRDVE